MKAAIRVDASVRIGSGHVMRCLTLAGALRDRGVESLFVCRDLEGNMIEQVKQAGFEVVSMAAPSDPTQRFGRGNSVPEHAHWLEVDSKEDAKETRAILEARAPWNWLVVDHYALDTNWEATMRTIVSQIMVIDDLADRSHDCDLLLDQNFYLDMEDRYEKLLPRESRRLLGPHYALLRPEFAAARKQVKERPGEVRRILVFFGGVDARNMTAKVLGAIASLHLSDISVDVVVGRANPYVDELRDWCRTHSFATLHVQVPNMDQLLATADLAIGAAGTATWERCCMGVPAVAWAVAKNQTAMLVDAANSGIVYGLPEEIGEEEDIAQHLHALIQNQFLRRHFADQGIRLVDGNGARRVANLIASPTVDLRLAGDEDSSLLLNWRNDPRVREYSFDTRPISRDAHHEWFNRLRADTNRYLLIGSIEQEMIGVIRFDVQDAAAEVSIYTAPDKQGRGYGTWLLEAGEDWLRGNRPEIEHISAIVRPDNAPSTRMFQKCGYREMKTCYRKRIEI